MLNVRLRSFANVHLRVLACILFGSIALVAPASAEKPTYVEYLKRTAVLKPTLDQWLSAQAWVKFDPELGYVLSNSLMPWGINKSSTIETVQANGARRAIMYAGMKSRINTYGDSFTESNQVSDGETWQEYMAGHLGEPVSNYGVGGFGFYQAYRRMLREESGSSGGKYVIMMICCDDSTRSLFRSRRSAFFEFWPENDGKTFHGNFWSNLEMDPATGEFHERAQLLRTPSDLYKMTDPVWMVEAQKDDLALQLVLYGQGKTRDLDRSKITQLARHLDFRFDWSASVETGEDGTASPMRLQAQALLNRYSQRASIYILSKARKFIRENNKELLIVLNGNASIEEMRTKGTREDQELIDYLEQERIPYVDLNRVFFDGLNKSGASAGQYMAPFLVNGIGHFNPSGNHFIAYQIIPRLVDLLDPKPTPYRNPNDRDFIFRDYLTGGMYEGVKP